MRVLSPDALTLNQRPPGTTAALIFSDKTVFWGQGFGALGLSCGEVVFNTGMTGYQEVITDPSYAGQIITFTFPHIGNVGINQQDLESSKPFARGIIVRSAITRPSNWRSTLSLNEWMEKSNIIGIAGLDTRAITRHIRIHGAPNAVLVHDKDGHFDLENLYEIALSIPNLEGQDLAKTVTTSNKFEWKESLWNEKNSYDPAPPLLYHVVAIDFGIKHNILRNLVASGCYVTVLPATTSASTIIDLNPDGVFLSNGPGDPAATGAYAIPMIQTLLKNNIPLFGICLGHQILALALGGVTRKMTVGHRGTNHPVLEIETGKVEITSQNHGFVVQEESLPDTVIVTHRSLFDGSVEGLALKNHPVFSVQYHPEASPGPQDSHPLFNRFTAMIKKHKEQGQ